jgi:hypothetical protein
MAKVVAAQSVSLDGFSAGINVREGNGRGDNVELLHAWIEERGFDRFRDAQLACFDVILSNALDIQDFSRYAFA